MSAWIPNYQIFIFLNQDDLKESDRILLDIFKQLEGNVAELSDNISNWRMSGSFISTGRPSSYTDIDFSSRSSYCEGLGTPYAINSLETILDTSSEDISTKTSHGSDSLLLPELENSLSYSPVLPSTQSRGTASFSGSTSSNSTKRTVDPHPHMKMSASLNKLANSPSISRLQDETSSNMSRNSSIDSGIQFASEAESGSTHGVMEAAHMTIPESEDDIDRRKSGGFADDIFAALGLK